MTEPGPTAPSTALVGKWRRVTADPCAATYPATITFAGGTYRGARAPEQGMIWWDAGIYRLEKPRKLVLATATDELVTYDVTVHGDRFEFTDATGCRVEYQRAKAGE
jgi:hypothetical protein